MAVASGSANSIIDAVMEKLAIAEYFEVTHSAENEAQGKPHPAVYLTALKKMQLMASDCIAFEDSVRGVQAAKAAGLFTIAVPEAINFNDPGFAVADIQLPTLLGFSEHYLQARAKETT